MKALAEFGDVDVKKYVENTLITGVRADIEELEGPMFDLEIIKAKFDVNRWSKEKSGPS